MRFIELLAPAKNVECAKEAILHGADAVYIGAPKFGARAAAGNSIEDIAELVEYAHRFYVRIYVALNTLLHDEELPEVEKLIWDLWNAGVDALIIQDMGILKLNLPPMPLHASTQTDNRTVGKVKFLEEVGFSQIVLARELPIEQIRAISVQTNVPLECFVHGSLCVSYSGQCYISQALSARSANRGACAQYCRLPYDMIDSEGNVILKQKHLLSLKDLDRSDQLEVLIDAGISSFKIEGRLKDVSYVKNVTALYRQKLDAIIQRRDDLQRSSSGTTKFDFKPDLTKSFNRGFTDYFLKERTSNLTNPNTPKSMGEPVGVVKEIRGYHFKVAGVASFTNGDGLSFLGKSGQFEGFRVNKVEENMLYPAKMPDIKVGDVLYRTFDQAFERLMEKNSANRFVAVSIKCWETKHGFALSMDDLNGCSVSIEFEQEKIPAAKPQKMQVQNQLTKLGNTLFDSNDCQIDWTNDWFVPVSIWAEQRRILCEKMLAARKVFYQRPLSELKASTLPYITDHLSYTGNVLNAQAKAFYEEHGVLSIEPAYESTSRTPQKGDVVMHNKFCLKYELGACPVHQKGGPKLNEPLFLVHNLQKLRLKFDCNACEMLLLME